jgi:hypothetical protein
MRTCRVCGILLPFGSILSVQKHNVGCICKVCHKYKQREKAKRLYLNGIHKAKMCKEPDKKICVVCNKSFWTSYSKSVCCGKECKCIRQKEIEKLWRLNK